MEISRTFDLLTNLKSYPDKADILAKKTRQGWIKYSITDYIDYSYTVAYALLALGYENGTKIVTVCQNRPEWNFVDMGANLAHMIHVPIYSTLSQEEYVHILTHSDAEVIFVGNQLLYNKISPIVESIDRNIRIIMMDDSQSVFSMQQLLQIGRENKEKYFKIVEDNVATISPDECCSIVYTSGTTGIPKGAMLSHRNLTFNSHGHALRQTKNFSHRMVSFLPLCHTYERTMNYEFQELGISIYYAESVATIAADLKDCQADGFCAVPRVLNMMYAKLEAAGSQFKGLKKCIYRSAWKYANNFDNYKKGKLYLAKQSLYDKLVYSKWRENLGGHEMLVVSGGSSIQAKIVRCFNCAKLFIYEGFGMTEASPVIAVNSPADGYNVIGTVGKALGGTELSFTEDGEILTRGPHVMLGYYKNPQATAEIIDEDGWLHTGDIGHLVDGQYLKITDRKKEIFKLSAGKYVAPQVIETKLKETGFFENAFVFGDNRKFASAILVPDAAKIEEFANNHKITFSDKAQLLDNPQIVKLLHNEVGKVNKTLSPHENIKLETYRFDDWTVDNGLLSQTLKLKRRNLLSRYSDIIEATYRNQN